MKSIRILAAASLSAGLVFSLAGEATAAARVGGSCPRVGATATSHGVKLVCKKNAAGKLVWKKRGSAELPPPFGVT